MNKIELGDLKCTVYQEADSNHGDDYQFLELSKEDAGGGFFYTLKTDRWAFDSIDELIAVVKEFVEGSGHLFSPAEKNNVHCGVGELKQTPCPEKLEGTGWSDWFDLIKVNPQQSQVFDNSILQDILDKVADAKKYSLNTITFRVRSNSSEFLISKLSNLGYKIDYRLSLDGSTLLVISWKN